MYAIRSYYAPFKHAGKTLLLAVAGFGIATIVFGLSTRFWLSVAMLTLLGGLRITSYNVCYTKLLRKVSLNMEITIEKGRGYVPAEENNKPSASYNFV